ncbi:MAG: penicillin acylase family protein [Myxococcota bacterium]
MKAMRSSNTLFALFPILASVLFLAAPFAAPAQAQTVLPGLQAPVSVTYDTNGVPHIKAENDLDLFRAEGYVHARDRFFQMDVTRRQVSGDLAELFGASQLGSDVGNRTVGLRRAAERSATALSTRERDLLQAYADGVNAFLAAGSLPIEYSLLELTSARPWNVTDSLVIGKAIAASLSFDLDDIDRTIALQTYIGTGAVLGFDGQALFSEDINRAAPMDPASTVPDATNGTPFISAKADSEKRIMLARAAEQGERAKDKLAQSPFLAQAMRRSDSFIGSNEWGVAAVHTKEGKPLIANDPHLSLNIPATFYEWHLISTADPVDGALNVSGIGFPGAPGVILGQNKKITWGATTNPMDVTDVFSDTLIVDPFVTCALVGSLACIQSAGQLFPVVIETAQYNVNLLDGVPDNVVPATLPPDQTTIATVPFRSFGPIIDIDDPSVLVTGGVTTALVVQYTGFHATRELQTFTTWNRAQNLADFLVGLADFDAGSQNWAYADVDGNLAYFASAENPLRADLEQGTVVGLPPFFIRDGSGPNNWVPDPARSQGQAIPFDVLPAAEMPQTVNPVNGYFVNANNDPAGTTLDNNPLNQVRPSKPTAIYYLNPGYAIGMRAGRITRLVEAAVTAGNVTRKQLKKMQGNVQQLDAELMTPFLLAAFANASAPGAAPELAALAADPGIAEAVGRLGAWDFSSPTGIPEGYDAKDKNGVRNPVVTNAEKKAAVAATIYNLWRAKVINAVVDSTLASLGLPGAGSTEALKAVHNLLSESPFDGVGASGVNFFPLPATLTDAGDRRDATLLTAVRTALDALASSTFAPAFANSTNQDDYLWGKLHRITFDHPFVSSFSVPPAGGFDDLAPALTGISRDGGYNVVNASGFSARADGLNSFKFGGGPVRRYVGGPKSDNDEDSEDNADSDDDADVRKIKGVNVVPGGPSGDPFSPDYTTQLGKWLTGEYHKIRMAKKVPPGKTASSESLVPAP